MTRQFRPTIFSNWTKKNGKPKVISITDNLNIQKLQFSGSESGTDAVRAYVSFKKALALANSILSGNFSKIYPYTSEYGGMKTAGRFVVYGGSASSKLYNGKPESRVIQIEQVQDVDQKNKPRVRFKIEIKLGEGMLGDQGAIMPANSKNMISQFQFVGLDVAYEMASMIKLHVDSYYAMYMEHFYDEKGNSKNLASIDDVFMADQRGVNHDEAPDVIVLDEEIPLV